MTTQVAHQHKTNGERIRCWKCSPPGPEELWFDFLGAYPNQHNEILRQGPEAFGWPPRETWDDGP